MPHERAAGPLAVRARVARSIARALTAASLLAMAAACGESRGADEHRGAAARELLVALGLEPGGGSRESRAAIVLRPAGADMAGAGAGARHAAVRRSDACPARAEARVAAARAGSPEQARPGSTARANPRAGQACTAAAAPDDGSDDGAYGAATVAANVERLEVRDSRVARVSR